MEIKKSIFQKFISGAMMSGIATVNECIINFADDSVIIEVGAANNMVAVQAKLLPSAFSNYEPIGKIGIEKLENLHTYITRCNDIIKIIKIEAALELISINDDGEIKKITCITKSPQYIKNVLDRWRSKEGEFEFKINNSKFQNLLADINLVKAELLVMTSIPPNKIYTKMKSYDTAEETIKVEVTKPCDKQLNVKYGQTLVDALRTIQGDLYIKLIDNAPIQAAYTDENMTLSYFVTPVKEEKI
jgi:hypothetical protein